MVSQVEGVTVDGSRGGLRRELRFWEAIAISIGIMAPTAAMALNGTAPAGLVGRAVPLAFLFAAIAVALIAYSFVRLTSFFNHAGSTYALAGATLGPRAGFFAGWTLLAIYSLFIAADVAEVGLFGSSFLSGAGIWGNPSWILISMIAAALVWLLAYGDVKVVGRALLSFEGISVALITVVVIIIFWKVIGHTAPNHQQFTLKPFVPASGTAIGAVAFASVFGLLSFGGFEGAAALGEETDNPRRNIPLAIAVAVGFCGVFYTIVMLAQSLGFGIGAAGVNAFSSSSAPVGDLAKMYVGSGMRDAINFGATLSAFASTLGCAAGASRILFALGRDGFITRRLGDASPRTGSPANALAIVMIFGVALTIYQRLHNTTDVNAFFYPGTAGVLAMLIAYFVIQFGAAKFLHLERREPRWRVIFLILATAAIVYTFYKQVHPTPAYPYNLFPYVIGGWAVLGIAITLAFPALARRIGRGLAEAEGIGGNADQQAAALAARDGVSPTSSAGDARGPDS
ncbi:MAG TPA: APC family permease [Solirubrobacteraceae bacterium]|nr:APC family permease [Solirubrobacteraceae bacterium]